MKITFDLEEKESTIKMMKEKGYNYSEIDSDETKLRFVNENGFTYIFPQAYVWSDVAKEISISKNKMLKLLRKYKILKDDRYKNKDTNKIVYGMEHNTPYEQYEQYFEVKYKDINSYYSTPVTITSKEGLVWLKQLFEEILNKENNIEIIEVNKNNYDKAIQLLKENGLLEG